MNAISAEIISIEAISEFESGACPSIRWAAELSDRLAQHLEPSWRQTLPLDVVSRVEIDAALKLLDELFVVEGRRHAFFRDPIAVSMAEEALAERHTADLIAFFEDPELSLLGSMLNLSDTALAWGLSIGMQPLAWNEKMTEERQFMIREPGGKLPVAYLSQAFNTAQKRMKRMMRQAGLPDDVVESVVGDIGLSVALEVLRAGINAGERIEALAIWCLQLQPFGDRLIVSCLLRGGFHIIHALLATVSARSEAEIRNACLDGDIAAMDEICADCGLSAGLGRFLIDAMTLSRLLGPVAGAGDLVKFMPRMIAWLEVEADRPDVPDAVLEIAVMASGHLDWVHGTVEEEQPPAECAEIIQLADFRR